jgi:RNA polymerase sigma factor (sigma-70 family)
VEEVRRVSESHPLAVLVSRAQDGDQHAWNAIVERFLPLVGAIARQHRLSEADADDVGQTVWLRLVEHLDGLREPAALPGWIRTTARHECLRLLAARGRTRAVDPQDGGLDTLDAVTDDVSDVELVAAERRQALRDALAELPEARRELLLLLLVDPPLAYEEISRQLGIPIGSIGPTRARAFAALRDTAALRRLALEPEGGLT